MRRPCHLLNSDHNGGWHVPVAGDASNFSRLYDAGSRSRQAGGGAMEMPSRRLSMALRGDSAGARVHTGPGTLRLVIARHSASG